MKIPCIKIEQPIGEFYLASLKTDFLKKVTHSKAAEFNNDEISGSQRTSQKNRVKEIRDYISTHNATIPNSIILSANYYKDDSFEVDPDKRWEAFEDPKNEGFYYLNIPDKDLEICSIIDGQHRINGFKDSDISMTLPCSIFIDLPPSSQALVFSTINFNQKPVDKSLAYQLFGYQLDESKNMSWSPDILAVKISRELNKKRPFEGKIQLIKSHKKQKSEWSISSASFIEGITSLITPNAKKDKYTVNKKKIVGYGSRNDLRENPQYPLRKFYLEGNDQAVITVIERFFTSISNHLWSNRKEDDIVFKTVGISAQFALLKEILLEKMVTLDKNLNFDKILSNLTDLDFSNEYFSARSATKKRVLDTFKYKLGLINEKDVAAEIIQAADKTVT